MNLNENLTSDIHKARINQIAKGFGLTPVQKGNAEGGYYGGGMGTAGSPGTEEKRRFFTIKGKTIDLSKSNFKGNGKKNDTRFELYEDGTVQQKEDKDNGGQTLLLGKGKNKKY